MCNLLIALARAGKFISINETYSVSLNGVFRFFVDRIPSLIVEGGDV